MRSKIIAFFFLCIFFCTHAFGQEYKTDHVVDTASYYNETGLEYYNRKDYENALRYFERSLQLRLKLSGEDNAGVATMYNNIGESYRMQKQYLQAFENHKKALQIRLRLFGENSLYVADSYNKVGIEHYFLGNYEESIKNYRCALDIRIALQGENNLDVATIYSNIGNSFFECKNYTSAIENYEQCLRIRKELKKEYSEETSLIYIKLCSANLEIKRYEEVIKNCKNAMEIYSYLQYDDKTIAPFYSLLAVAYYSLGDFVNTVEYGEKYISLADVSTNRIDILKIVGNAYHSMGKLDFALDRLEKASKNIYDKSMYSLTFQINSIKEYIETGEYKWTYEYQREHGASKTREMLINSSKYILEKYGKYSEEYISAIDCVIKTYESGEYNIESVNWQKEKLDAQIHVLGYDDISTWATYNRITSLFEYSHQIQEAMTIDSIMAESGSYQYIDDLARRHYNYGNYRTSFNIYPQIRNL